jgi:hypothetical protein
VKVAVITPYYKEPVGMLERCHRSVKAQTHADVRHFMVADGFPNPAVDGWDCEHIKLPNCGDYGDTPRGIGAAVASVQGYDAICLLDADCWFDVDHIEELLAAIKRSGAVIATCPRNLYRLSGTFMRVDVESDGVNFNDTNCYLFTTPAFVALRMWLFKTKKQAMFGDRELWKLIGQLKLKTGRSIKATLNYTTGFAAHYIGIGEEPPGNAKIFAKVDGKDLTVSWAAVKEHERRQKERNMKKSIEATTANLRNPVTVVCWLWNDPNLPYAFRPEYVNRLQSMLKRNLTVPHRFVCITDEPAEDFAKEVEVIPTPESARPFLTVKTPEGGDKPSCYRRLWLFSKEASVLGEKILMIDVDFVITGNIDHIVGYGEDFIGWENPTLGAWGTDYFIGCLWLHKTGTRTHVWENFRANPAKAIQDARAAGYRGSDQAWISYNLYGKEKKFSSTDGIYSILDHSMTIPKNSRLIQFNGPRKPWDLHHTWITDNWK